VLKLKQREVFDKLRNFSDFYLVGGTALALQIGHRVSIDFDLFKEKELDKNFIAKIYRVFKGQKINFFLRHSEQMNVEINSVKINFVKYPYPLIFKLKTINGVKTASIKEITLMKSFTLGRRATLKDYVDLYFILQKKIMSLEKIIKGCTKKYGKEFNDRLFLEELTYLEDVGEGKIEFLKKPLSRQQIEQFFVDKIKEIKI
jgi:hypothetical protein